MKPIYTLLFFMFFAFSQKSIAQKNTAVNSGVYISKDDFINNKLTQEADCQDDKEIFKKHNFFMKAEFSIINKGKKITYLKKDIYAYRDCENTVWRFYNNQEYEIMETKAIYIYAIRKIVLVGENIERDPIYYFSHGATGNIEKLTIANLKEAFKQNKPFGNLLDGTLNAENTIEAYDSTHKMYEVNYLYKQSVK
jgi:hypothetical protein